MAAVDAGLMVFVCETSRSSQTVSCHRYKAADGRRETASETDQTAAQDPERKNKRKKINPLHHTDQSTLNCKFNPQF